MVIVSLLAFCGKVTVSFSVLNNVQAGHACQLLYTHCHRLERSKGRVLTRDGRLAAHR